VGYHNAGIHTPNIDDFAEENIVLDRFYACPMSSPTRAGLLTGRYPNRYGLREVVVRPWFDYGLDTNEVILPQILAGEGYENRALIGKWHLGHSRIEYHPLKRGFTYFYGHLNGAIDYFSHEREGELDWHEGYETSYDEGYSTDLITTKTIECIRKYTGESPFFIYVSYNAPHTPLQAQAEYLELCGYNDSLPKFQNVPGKGNSARQTYEAMVANLDNGFGKILETLDELNIEDNTLVIFMSDNGAETRAGGSSGDLRGRKLTEWEGGVRVPAIIRWPKEIQGKKSIDQVMGNIDIVPTLLDIIDFKDFDGYHLDGISMLPVLKGETQHINRNFYLGNGALVNNDWKLIARSNRNPDMEIFEDLLFHISGDPNETTNVMQDQSEIFNYMMTELSKFESIVPSMIPPVDSMPENFVAPIEWKLIHTDKE
jgi:arylsulfatase B